MCDKKCGKIIAASSAQNNHVSVKRISQVGNCFDCVDIMSLFFDKSLLKIEFSSGWKMNIHHKCIIIFTLFVESNYLFYFKISWHIFFLNFNYFDSHIFSLIFCLLFFCYFHKIPFSLWHNQRDIAIVYNGRTSA